MSNSDETSLTSKKFDSQKISNSVAEEISDQKTDVDSFIESVDNEENTVRLKNGNWHEKIIACFSGFSKGFWVFFTTDAIFIIGFIYILTPFFWIIIQWVNINTDFVPIDFFSHKKFIKLSLNSQFKMPDGLLQAFMVQGTILILAAKEKMWALLERVIDHIFPHAEKNKPK